MLPPVNFMAPNATLEDSGFQSFRAVAIAFAASRGLLALEYLVGESRDAALHDAADSDNPRMQSSFWPGEHAVL